MPIAPAIIAAGIGAGSGLLGDIISGINVRRMNKYNSPVNQVRRLREARLPMAALTSGNAGQQSALPETSGIKGIGGQIAQGVTTQASLKEQAKIIEETRTAKAMADLTEATRNWSLDTRGSDTAGTNLTTNLISESNLKKADVIGKDIANSILSGEKANQAFKLNAENQKLIAETEKILKDIGFIDEKIESENINQKIQNVLAQYQPYMSNAQLEKLYKENGLISEHIHGARLDNGIKILNKRILEETAGNMITQSDLDTAMKQVLSADQWSKFTQTKEYNQMLDKARAIFQADAENFNPIILAERLSALLYTSFQQFTGMAGKILGGQ